MRSGVSFPPGLPRGSIAHALARDATITRNWYPMFEPISADNDGRFIASVVAVMTLGFFVAKWTSKSSPPDLWLLCLVPASFVLLFCVGVAIRDALRFVKKNEQIQREEALAWAKKFVADRDQEWDKYAP